jgi:hypothetical protein
MRFLPIFLLTIGLQLALGALICIAWTLVSVRPSQGTGSRARRRTAIRARSATSLVRSLPLAVTLSLAGAAIHLAQGAKPGVPEAWLAPTLLLVPGAVSTSGGYLVFHAARLEASGRLRRARRQVRSGGRLMAGGVLLLLTVLGAALALGPGFRREMPGHTSFDGAILLSGVLTLGVAGIVALLAGLSGKPRPSGGIAVLLYLCGLAGVLYSAT